MDLEIFEDRENPTMDANTVNYLKNVATLVTFSCILRDLYNEGKYEEIEEYLFTRLKSVYETGFHSCAVKAFGNPDYIKKLWSAKHIID